MIVVYYKIPEIELRNSMLNAVKQIDDWFTNNPKRRVCKTELWYGRTHTIKKKDVRGQLIKIVEEILQEDRRRMLK
jgi:hypothetical protein